MDERSVTERQFAHQGLSRSNTIVALDSPLWGTPRPIAWNNSMRWASSSDGGG
jgi:hypothetical protein